MMVAQPHHVSSNHAPDFNVHNQQVDYGSYSEYPPSMSTAGSSSSIYHQGHSHPSSSTLPPTPISSSESQGMPRSHSSGSHQWYGGGSATPPSAGGSASTPPYVRNSHHQPQYSRQHSNDTYTPLYADSQLVTPSTQPYHSGPMSSLPLMRPTLTSSISFPGPIFPSVSHPGMSSQSMPGFPLPLINVNGNGHALGQSYDPHPGPDQKFHFGMPPPPVPHIYTGTEAQRHMYNLGPNGVGEGEWVGEWEDDEHPGEWYSGNMEIKHRRRTSPEQLKVLEHWFDINSKPDNALREWLAGELGMTKRNVQVWFQNRRAKIKGQHIKDKAAMEKAAREAEGQKTPEGQITPARPSPFSATTPPEHPFPQALRDKAEAELYANVRTASMLPPVSDRNLSIPALPPLPNGGRRVSLANGEAKEIQTWAAKRGGSSGSGGGAAPKSPVIGQAAAARRGSIPYPTPLSLSTMDSNRNLASSPKFSPLVRPAPSLLHLAAMRNNTRRASMPGAPQLPGPPQLLSSGPFTPPRIVSYPVPNSLSTGLPSVLTSIKDNDQESPTSDIPHFFSGPDSLPTFISPTESTYSGGYPLTLSTSTSSSGPGSYRPPQSTELYNVNGPLPSPAFSFGQSGISTPGAPLPDEEAQRQQALFESFHRGRMGSVASIGSTGTLFSDATGATSGTLEEGDLDGPFNANRRASAPTGLLDFGLLGLDAFPNNGMPLRPSPLGIGNGFTAAEPSLPPTYGHPSQNHLHNQMQLSIPHSGSHEQLSPHSSNGPFMHASPVEMGSCLSAAPSTQSHSPHSPIRLSPAHTGVYQAVSTQDRRLPGGLDENLWDFVGGEGHSDGFSMLVPSHSGSAPMSAHSSSSQQQQGLLAPVYIPGKANSVSPGSS